MRFCSVFESFIQMRFKLNRFSSKKYQMHKKMISTFVCVLFALSSAEECSPGGRGLGVGTVMKWKITYNTYSQQNILFLHFALLIHKNDVTLYFFYLNVYRFLCYIRGMSPIPCRFSKTRQRQYNVTIGFIVININISLPLSILRVISSSEWRNSPR